MRIGKLGLIGSSILALALIGCGKKGGNDSKDKDDESNSTDEDKDGDKTGDQPKLSENILAPAGALTLALDSLQSIMATDISATMVGAGAGASLAGEEGFKEEDCSEHAEAVWRDGDGDEFKDNGDGGVFRLRSSHPRHALQTLYCQMQKDTHSSDSFLGAISQNKLMFCLLKDLTFDGQPHDKTIQKADFLACLDAQGATQEDKDDFTGNMSDSVTGKITAAAPAALGKPGEWDASIDFEVDVGGKQTLRILLKDDEDAFAMSVNNNGGHANPTDAYVVQIGKKSGEVRFESKMQRIRETNGESNAGWNRHARIYVKGTMDANLKFTSVSDVQGAYSDVSVNVGNIMPQTPEEATNQIGTFWTVVGNDQKGFLSNSYDLKCTGNGTDPYVCEDANKAASWKAAGENTVGVCNGGTGGNCTGTDLKVAADADTAFVMDGKHASFEKTEDWFANLALPAYTTINLGITQ